MKGIINGSIVVQGEDITTILEAVQPTNDNCEICNEYGRINWTVRQDWLADGMEVPVDDHSEMVCDDCAKDIIFL